MLNNPVIKAVGKTVGSIVLGQVIVFTSFVTVGLASKTVEKLTTGKPKKSEQEETERIEAVVKGNDVISNKLRKFKNEYSEEA